MESRDFLSMRASRPSVRVGRTPDMQDNTFLALLSNLSAIVEQLAKVHEREVEQALVSKVMESKLAARISLDDPISADQDASKPFLNARSPVGACRLSRASLGSDAPKPSPNARTSHVLHSRASLALQSKGYRMRMSGVDGRALTNVNPAVTSDTGSPCGAVGETSNDLNDLNAYVPCETDTGMDFCSTELEELRELSTKIASMAMSSAESEGKVEQEEQEQTQEDEEVYSFQGEEDFSGFGSEEKVRCSSIPSQGGFAFVHHQPTITALSLSLALSDVQFRPRKPWSDHPEFDDVKVSEILQKQLAKGMFKQKASALQVRKSVLQPSVMYEESHFVRSLIGHPESKCRGYWVLGCVMFLLYDLIMVPFQLCFDLEDTEFTRTIDIMTMVWWTLDICLNFLTGVQTGRHLEMRPRYIAKHYVQSYFIIDLILVVPDWITLVDARLNADSITILRVARWWRFMRLLRLARVMKIVRMRGLLRQLFIAFHVDTLYLQVTQGWIGLCLIYLLALHVLSCCWYATGNAIDHGWIHANNLQGEHTMNKYIISFRWTAGRFAGIGSTRLLKSPEEELLDALLIFSSFILASFLIGAVTALSMTRINSKSMNLWRYGIRYVRRHRISPELDKRLVKVLAALNTGGAAEVEIEEQTLLEALPVSLHQDLLFEARVDCLSKKHFLADMALINERVVVRISTAAMSSHFSVEREVLFAYGDACDSVLFITSGTYWYAVKREPDMVIDTADRMSEGRGATWSSLASMDDVTKLTAETALCEPVLWTAWEHCGSLLSVEESTVLALDSAKFANVVVQHKIPCMHMVRYAKLFVWHLNHMNNMDNGGRGNKLTDLIEFTNLVMQNLDEKFYDGTPEDHFMFISHYKLESGTEATLIRELMEPMLRADLSHPANNLRAPIFIDSENLIDLTQLKEHIKRSVVFVLLLTPNVLSRPWCLIEIVTAVQNDVVVVPVEVQRPGSKYKYPDDEFYIRLLAGLSLNDDALTLLEHEGTNLFEVEQALRQVFAKIALPFSPHKTHTVREAELIDILKRCNDADREHFLSMRSSNG